MFGLKNELGQWLNNTPGNPTWGSYGVNTLVFPFACDAKVWARKNGIVATVSYL